MTNVCVRELPEIEPQARSMNVRDLFGVGIHAIRMDAAIEQVLRWTREPGYHCRYVVTPNVDHIVLLQSCGEFHNAYLAASLVLADGWPVVAASRLLGQPLPERVAGSDLAPRLFAAASVHHPLRLCLFGAAPGVGDQAAARIVKKWPGVQVCRVICPRFGFELDAEEDDEAIAQVNAARPDVLIIGLGAPRQEVWLHQRRHRLEAKVAIAAGATIDFLAGKQVRAPRWVQRVGLEWLHRLATNPRRLAKRYATDARKFPLIVIDEWRKQRRRAQATELHKPTRFNRAAASITSEVSCSSSRGQASTADMTRNH
jgi:N-acetylglucosaminyldiphosphoundecaprenol N-acetyl-beta-D-mannosaminyltransferase